MNYFKEEEVIEMMIEHREQSIDEFIKYLKGYAEKYNRGSLTIMEIYILSAGFKGVD